MDNILISACLAGVPCRYNAQSKYNKNIELLKQKFNLILVCPEQLGGLSTPRAASEIKNLKVITTLGHDVTRQFLIGAKKTYKIAQKYKCKFAIFKSNSPSCSSRLIYDGSFSGKLVQGRGITAEYFINKGFLVYDESDIENIIKGD